MKKIIFGLALCLILTNIQISANINASDEELATRTASSNVPIDLHGLLSAYGDISITTAGGPVITGVMLRGTSNAVVALAQPNIFYTTATTNINPNSAVTFETTLYSSDITTTDHQGFKLPATGIYDVAWQIFGRVNGLPEGYLVIKNIEAGDQVNSAIGYSSTNSPINGHTLVQASAGQVISLFNRVGTLTPSYFGGISGLAGAPTGTLTIKRIA